MAIVVIMWGVWQYFLFYYPIALTMGYFDLGFVVREPFGIVQLVMTFVKDVFLIAFISLCVEKAFQTYPKEKEKSRCFSNSGIPTMTDEKKEIYLDYQHQ